MFIMLLTSPFPRVSRPRPETEAKISGAALTTADISVTFAR